MSQQQRTNPESEFHRRILEKERTAHLRVGRIALWEAFSLLVVFTFLNIVLAFSAHLSFWFFLLIECVLVGGLSVMFFLFGWTEFQVGKRPVTDQEVEERRQSERARLLREARGILPIAFRLRVLIVEFVLGVVFIAAGVVLLVSPYATPLVGLWGRLYGIGCILCGFSFLSLVLIVKRRRAKQIPAISARELSNRLTLGEITEGNGSGRAGDDQVTGE